MPDDIEKISEIPGMVFNKGEREKRLRLGKGKEAG